MTTYKVLGIDGEPYHGGVGAWSLPTKRSDGSWEPGEWREVEGDLVPCENGLHLCEGEHQLLQWLGPTICEAECEGETLRDENKLIARRARLLRVFETWNERTARLFVCDCAEHVLPIFERELSDDNRPRVSIETARRFANGEATHDELSAARDAASDAAWAADRYAAGAVAAAAAGAAAGAAAWAAARDVWDAAWDAARAAAGAAARAAARDVWDAAWAAARYADRAAASAAARAAAGAAARAAASAAERDWQVTRLRQYLIGEVTR